MQYSEVRTVDEALAALDGGDTEIVAGGTDLVVGARNGKRALPEAVVAIHAIDELKGLEASEGDGLTIGALVNHETLYRSEPVRATWSALSDGSALIGSPATRHIGTLGGNLANASPAMDTGAPLIILGAEVTLRSTRGARRIAVGDLFAGPGRSTITRDELLVSVHVPAPGPHAGSAYVRLEYRQAMEIAVVGAAAMVRLDAAGQRVESARVALSAVAPTIVRATAVEERLAGAPATPEAFAKAAEAAADAASPISDVRATADYRRAVVCVIARRALEAAAARARGEHVPVPASRDHHRRSQEA